MKRKLMLNKTTISNLNHSEKNQIRGGVNPTRSCVARGCGITPPTQSCQSCGCGTAFSDCYTCETCDTCNTNCDQDTCGCINPIVLGKR